MNTWSGWLCLVCFALASGFAQQNGPAGQPVSPASVPLPSSNHLITLDVVVTDKSGKPIPGLQQQDFTLLDNKEPQKISSFEAVQGRATTGDPVEVILLIDEANTTFTHVAVAREQTETFLKRDGGELARPVSLAFLSDSGLTIGKISSRDGNALATDLSQSKSGLRTITKSQGIYGAGDRLQLSLRGIEQLIGYESTRPGRKLVIWISPGWPLLSGPREELTSKAQQVFFSSIVALSNGLRRARITLYNIDPLGTDAGQFRNYYEAFVKGVKKPSQVQIGNLGLQVLAVQSGGRVLNFDNDLAGEIATCVTDANAFYVLSFEGTPGDGEDEYHSIEIKIDKPGLKARTRTGYYAQPAQAQ
jgi:VWFA-related protein